VPQVFSPVKTGIMVSTNRQCNPARGINQPREQKLLRSAQPAVWVNMTELSEAIVTLLRDKCQSPVPRSF
jgi:hypothetical protein